MRAAGRGAYALCAGIAVALSTGVAAPAQAQTRTIQGVVRDSATGETLPFATVAVEGSNLRGITSREGHFVLIGAPAASLVLRITMLGYQPVERRVAQDASGALVVPMARVPFKLEALSVTAKDDNYTIMRVADDIVGQVTISPRDIAALPSIGGTDVFRSLQLLPGISGTNETSAGLYVRGGTPDQTLVLLDGITVYHVDHFFGFFSAFNADAIKDVQVYKGGFPAEYGGRISSVVDLTGKSGDVKTPRLDVDANLLSASTTAQLPLFGHGSVLLSARRSYTDILRTGLYNSIYQTLTGDTASSGLPNAGQGVQGMPRNLGGGGGGRGGLGGPFANAQTTSVTPDFYFYDLNGKATYNPSTRDVVSVSLYNGQDDLDQSNSQTRDITLGNIAGRTLVNDLTDVTGWGNHGISGRWARQWGARFSSTGLFSYSTYFSDYTRATHSEQSITGTDSVVSTTDQGNVESNRVGDFTGRLDNEWEVTRTHRARFGFWATQSDVSYSLVRDDTLSILARHQTGLRLEGFAEDKWSIFPALTVTAGLRATGYDRTASRYLEPRIAGSLKFSSHFKVSGAYGRYHQFVNQVVRENVTQGARDFWLLADTALIPVQGSTHYVAGITYETRSLLFDVQAYRKDITGLAEFSLRFQQGSANLGNLFFQGTGVAQGIEVLAQKKTGKYTGWLSYTLGQAENRFPGLNDGKPFPALQDQTHELKAVSTLDLGRLNLAATWTFGSGKPYTAPEAEYTIRLLDGSEQSYIHVSDKNSLRLPPYHRLDVSAQFRFALGRTRGEVGLSVFNAYNHSNVWYRQFDLSAVPVLVTDVRYLGLTPNLNVQLHF